MISNYFLEEAHCLIITRKFISLVFNQICYSDTLVSHHQLLFIYQIRQNSFIFTVLFVCLYSFQHSNFTLQNANKVSHRHTYQVFLLRSKIFSNLNLNINHLNHVPIHIRVIFSHLSNLCQKSCFN